MPDFDNEITEHEQLERRITAMLEKTQVRAHRIELQRQLAAVREDLNGMRQHRWLTQDRHGPWMAKR